MQKIMKQLLILLTTLASLTLSGQDAKPTQKILIGFNFSPDYNFRTLKNSDGSTSSDYVIKSRNNIEVAKFGFTTGVNVCFNFSQLVAFETGIQFTNKGYKTKNLDLTYIPPNTSLPAKAKTFYAGRSYLISYCSIAFNFRDSFAQHRAYSNIDGCMGDLLFTASNSYHALYSIKWR